jgi:hypothetical protein
LSIPRSSTDVVTVDNGRQLDQAIRRIGSGGISMEWLLAARFI